MKTKEIDIKTLHLNDGTHGLPKNPRFIRDDKFHKLCQSIKDNPEYMPARPIVVDEKNVVLGGNMRLRACVDLKMKTISADWVRVVTGWTVEKKRRFIILDNRGFGEDDFDLLGNEWDIDELLAAGFDEKELAGVMDDGEPEDAEPQIDRAEELNEKWKVKKGDLWLIGEHRLLCGDSTNAEDVARLMDGQKATCVFTDPPYGVAYSGLGQSTHQQTIENDDLNPEELNKFLFSAFKVMPCADGCNVFVCHADGRRGIQPAFEDAFFRAGFIQGCKIIWVKNVASMGWQDFRAAHEPILFGWKDGKKRVRVEDRSLTTVWNVGREGNYLHPTTKPVELVSIAIKSCSVCGAIVWDSFLGSGTTMIAAQNLNRKCYGIEISPAYCAVILERMITAFPDIDIRKGK